MPNWTNEELKELKRFFKNNSSEMTLYLRLHKLNKFRTFEAVARMIRRLREEGYTKSKDDALKNLRVGYLDIEADSLNANFGIILSWVIKRAGKNEYDSAVVTKNELFNYQFDKRVLKELLKALDNYDVIYTHWGVDRCFDIPYIRTRAYANGLENQLPKYMEKFILDTYPIARNKLKLHSNRLEAIALALNITSVKKTPLSPKQWQLAKVGHPGALKYVCKHNRRDAQILELVHKKLKLVERPIYRSW